MVGHSTIVRRVATLLVGLLLLGVAGGGARAAQGDLKCIADWTEAARIVRSEKLVEVKDIQAQARQRFRGDLIRVTLCEGPDAGHYAYRLVVFDQGQGVRTLIVDARNPFSSETASPQSAR